MNNTFNIKRFGRYFAYDLKSRWNDQRVFLAVFALLPIIFYLVFLFFSMVGHSFQVSSDYPLTRPPLPIRSSVFVMAASIFLVLFPSKAYGFLTDKAEGSAWIELPASRLEKFTSMMLISLIVIPVIFFLVYLISDGLVCLLDKSCGGSVFSAWSNIHLNGIDDPEEVWFVNKGFWFMVNGVLQTVSVFLLGALIFKKGKVAKTILVLFALSIILSIIFGIIVSTIGPESFGEGFKLWAKGHADRLDFWFNLAMNTVLAVVVIGCGIWSWFRVKNLQH